MSALATTIVGDEAVYMTGNAPAANDPPFDVDPPVTLRADGAYIAGDTDARRELLPDAAPADAEPSATALALVEVNNNIAEFDAVEAGLQDIEKRFGGVLFDVQTPKGFKAAKEARAEVRKPRYAVQNAVKNAKTPLNALKKALDLRGEAIIKRIEAVETPIDQQVTDEEKRRQEEKERLEKEAADRKAQIDEAIAEINGRVVACLDQSADFIGETIQWLDNTEVTEEDYGDRADEVRAAVRNTRDRLVGMKATAEAMELMAANAQILANQMKAQQEELDRRTAALERREAIAERIDTMRGLPDALVMATPAVLRAVIAAMDAELTEENFGNRLAEARAAAAIVAPELAALLAEAALEPEQADAEEPAPQQQEAAPGTYTGLFNDESEGERIERLAAAPVVLATPPAPAPAPAPVAVARAPRQEHRPTDAQLIEVIALHYRVHESKAIQWLLEVDLIAASARLAPIDGDCPF